MKRNGCFLAVFAMILTIGTQPVLAQSGPRHALVIGNSAYRHTSTLRNPVNDANDVSAKLRSLGFEVKTLLDADIAAMEQALREYAQRLRVSPGTDGIFYYAGHAVQSGGVNYLLPIDANIQAESELRRKAISAQEVLENIEGAGNAFNMVVLDACRDNPFAGSFRSAARGLAVTALAPPETMIIYATGAGDVAADGYGRNSPFTQAFLANIGQAGLPVTVTVQRIMADVQRLTSQRQRPWQYSSVSRDVYLAGSGTGSASGSPAAVSVTPSASTPTLSFGAVTVATGSLNISVASAATVSLLGQSVELPAGATLPVNNVAVGEVSVAVHYTDGKTEYRNVRVEATRTTSLSFDYRPSSTPAKPAAGQQVLYKIGDRGPAGGIVFYDKGNNSDGWRYLEAWTADEKRNYTWKTIPSYTQGATSIKIGSGQANTQAMSGSEHPAAEVVRNARYGGYSDWFLPSKDELNLMYQNLKTRNLGGFGSGWYWSSSESDRYIRGEGAWRQKFSNGEQDHNSKDSLFTSVRAVRAFTD